MLSQLVIGLGFLPSGFPFSNRDNSQSAQPSGGYILAKCIYILLPELLSPMEDLKQAEHIARTWLAALTRHSRE